MNTSKKSFFKYITTTSRTEFYAILICSIALIVVGIRTIDQSGIIPISMGLLMEFITLYKGRQRWKSIK